MKRRRQGRIFEGFLALCPVTSEVNDQVWLIMGAREFHSCYENLTVEDMLLWAKESILEIHSHQIWSVA